MINPIVFINTTIRNDFGSLIIYICGYAFFSVYTILRYSLLSYYLNSHKLTAFSLSPLTPFSAPVKTHDMRREYIFEFFGRSVSSKP